MLDPYTHKTSDYTVRAAVSQVLTPGKTVYQVSNNLTGVVEYESHRLFDALEGAILFQRRLDAYRRGEFEKEIMQDEGMPPIPVIPGRLN